MYIFGEAIILLSPKKSKLLSFLFAAIISKFFFDEINHPWKGQNFTELAAEQLTFEFDVQTKGQYHES